MEDLGTKQGTGPMLTEGEVGLETTTESVLVEGNGKAARGGSRSNSGSGSSESPLSRLVREMVLENVRYEGFINYMYADVKRLVTVGIGHMMPTPQDAMRLPFITLDGQPASKELIRQEWVRVKNHPSAWERGHTVFLQGPEMHRVRLTNEAVYEIAHDQMRKMIRHVQPVLHFSQHPEPVQRALTLMLWAMGPSGLLTKFPKFCAAIRRRDYATAAAESEIKINVPGRRFNVDHRNNAIRAYLLSAVSTAGSGKV